MSEMPKGLTDKEASWWDHCWQGVPGVSKYESCDDMSINGETVANFIRTVAALRAKLVQGADAVTTCVALAQAAPELNMSNYHYDQVADLNTAMCEIYGWLGKARDALEGSGPTKFRAIHIVFDGPPGPEPGRFIEVEDAEGHGVNVGRWEKRADGYHVLVLNVCEEVASGPRDV